MRDLVGHARKHGLSRLVLVPTGILGRVPWHAAYRIERGERRYAVHDLVVSYTVSARMLCAAATHPLRPSTNALVVGNPGGDLPFAGVKARAVHRRFYPQGTFLGRDATPDAVLDWVRRAAPDPSTLSFACHARANSLVLARGDLDAGRLLAASRLAELVVDRVFLAACGTNAVGDHYDEAFSLSSAFLAAGAHTVFGSLWSVPDRDTSVLMYLLHHFLAVENHPPAEALHRAQLWMLDGARRAPDGTPEELRTATVNAADPVSWAAFTHLGR